MQLRQFYIVCLFLARQPPSGPGPPHSRGFSIAHNDALQSAGLLWSSDQLIAETLLQTSMFPVGFDPTISAGQRPQTYALGRAATGTAVNCR